MILATLGAAVFGTLAGLVFPRVTELVIDRVLIAHRPDLLLPYLAIVVVSFLLRDGLDALRIRWNNTLEQAVVFDLRHDLYATLQRLPLHWFDRRSTGDIITRVIDDVTSMERVLIDGVEQGLIALLQIVAIGFLLFYLDPFLALLALAPVPFLIAGSVWYTTTARDRYRAQRRAASAMNSLLVDNLQGVRQIKSYAREEPELGRFGGAARLAGDTQLEIMRTWGWYSSGMSFLAALGTALVLYAGGIQVLEGHLTQGALIAFLLYVAMFYAPVARLHSINQLYQGGRAASERVTEILETAPEDYGTQHAPLVRARGEIVYRQVGYGYRADVAALHDIDLRIEPGQCVALVGPTGAGKSTLAALLSRFYEATSGTVELDGRDVRTIPLRELREQIGVVAQETFLFNGTILDNLRFGRPDATQAEIEKMATAACVDEFVRRLPEGYLTQIGERGVRLSVGEKQRISIARALLKDPPVLVLDEATASVDNETERAIQRALNELIAGRTSFVIAHRLSTIRHADLILVLQQGRIVERGRHEELLAQNGLYARLCRAQQTDFISPESLDALFPPVAAAPETGFPEFAAPSDSR